MQIYSFGKPTPKPKKPRVSLSHEEQLELEFLKIFKQIAKSIEIINKKINLKSNTMKQTKAYFEVLGALKTSQEKMLQSTKLLSQLRKDSD